MFKNQPRSHCGKIRVSQGKHVEDKVKTVKVITVREEATELRTEVLGGSSVWILKSMSHARISANMTVTQELKRLRNEMGGRMSGLLHCD